VKIIFAGTSHFAEPALQALIDYCNYSSTADLNGVYTQPDRPKGRGQRIGSTPIKTLAQRYSIPIYQPLTLKTEAEQHTLSNLAPDILIVAAYGLLLPPEILTIPTLGCINIHASLLPRWRGAAPIQRALLAGDEHTGITIMQMDAGLDTGDILYMQTETIFPQDTYDSLHARLATLGAKCLIETLDDLEHRRATRRPQPTQDVCYAHKINKSEGLIHWTQPAHVLERQIRAFNAWPVSFTALEGKRIRVWAAEITEYQTPETVLAGTIVEVNKTGITVATGQGYLKLTILQLEGGRCLPVAQLLNGQLAHIHPGLMFENID
jgi:methionyl-tRNA formyltransferase